MEEDDKPESRQSILLHAPYARLLREQGTVLHRSGVGQVEYLIACQGRDMGMHARMEELGIPVLFFRGGFIHGLPTEEALAERLYEAWRAEYAKGSPSQATWAQLREGGLCTQEDRNGWLAVARLALRGGS